MLRALSLFAALFGAICMVIALAHIALGPAAIPGSVPVNATMDSEDRFYATLFLGYGAAMIWSSRALVPRRDVFGALLLIFFLGGIARIISALAVGLPNTLFIVLGSAELLLPPMLWALLKRAAHQAAIRRNS
ncbi:DUF4345 domain-containing protein [Sphingopyxis sp.]|uniref:DUF4345 domain-containing protein n=1 Tax=Sphingopyxis sp. TaxID=1908224 RepID=UPI0025DE8B64|nr:DUF4345 domain-containing protein [Sphingopyxis sp.]MBK6412782.1 DUF4345 domain-containing protein [Sphingopyxis sp.]